MRPKLGKNNQQWIFDYVIKLFPEDFKPKNKTQIYSWKDEIDKMIRIDERDKKELCEVVRFARGDDFWQSKFLTIKKLRNKDKNGIKYYDVFNQLRIAPKKTNNNGTKETFTDQHNKLRRKFEELDNKVIQKREQDN